MHNWQCASKLFRPLILSTIISNILWSGLSIASERELTYSPTISGPSSVALSDAISGDGNYKVTVKVYNPGSDLEVYIGETEVTGKTYDIGNYYVDIIGQNTTNNPYTAFFGLATDKNDTISLNSFIYKNNLLLGGGD